MSITVEHSQCLMDVAVQYCGDATALFELAMLNGISSAADVAAGTILDVPDAINAEIAAYFSVNNIIPATADAKIKKTAGINLEGIGYWGIGVDFIVS